MKNMYAVAVMAAMVFASCGNDDVTGQPDQSSSPLQILGNISGMNEQPNSRAIDSAWGVDDRIGVTVEENISGNDVDNYVNIQYRSEGGNAFRAVNEGSTDNNIYLKGDGAYSLYAYYPYTGENKTLPGTEGILTVNTKDEFQTVDKQPQIDFLFAQVDGIRKGSPVEFTFAHKMTKVVFKFKAINGATLNDMTCRLINLQLDGTFNVTTGEATASAEPIDPKRELKFMVAKPDGDQQMTASIILLPQSIAEDVLLEVKMNDETYTATLPAQELKAGWAHPHNVTFENPAMTIKKAEIEPWEVEDDKDVTASVTE